MVSFLILSDIASHVFDNPSCAEPHDHRVRVRREDVHFGHLPIRRVQS